MLTTIFQGSVIALQYDSILPHTNTIILQVSYCGTITEAGSRVLSSRTDARLRVVYQFSTAGFDLFPVCLKRASHMECRTSFWPLMFFPVTGYSYERLDGSVRGEERFLAIQNFNETEDTFIFLLSTRAGTFLNIKCAPMAIMYQRNLANHTVDFP